jgi:diguanylate cyclase (GGDEF)-like protein
MLDIDHFKRVNDTFGHATGDQVLRAVARRCKFTIRDFDILGRYGGEEFAILLPETNLSAGQMVAERLRKEVATAPIDTDREALRITISLGVAKASNETSNLSVLLDHADTAMYAAKQSGRNRVMVV